MKAQQESPGFEEFNQGGQKMFNWDMLSKMAPALMKQQLDKLPADQRKIFEQLEVKCIARESTISIEVDYHGDDQRGPEAAKNMLNSLATQLPNMLALFGCKVKVYE